MKKLQKTIASVAFMLCFALLFQSIKVQAAADTEMTIYGIYLESQDKGESVLLESRGHYLLMDLGSAGSVPAIVKQLKKLGITELDLYFSHLHMDHYGGKSGGRGNTTDGIQQLLQSGIKVNTLYLPDLSLSPEAYDYQNKYSQIVQAVGAKNTVALKVGSTFQVGDAHAEVLGPVNTDQIHPSDYANMSSSGDGSSDGGIQYTYYENNCCLMTMFTCGNTKYFTVGDVLEDQTNFMVDKYGTKLKADILQLSHHGTGSGNTERFLAAVQPQYAFAQNTGLTGISPTTKKWLTNASRKNVIPYGMCYLVADEQKTIIYRVKNNQIRVYENEVNDSSMLDGWVRLTGADGQFRQIDRFYFKNGEPLKGVQTIDGKTYYFGNGGSMDYGNFNANAVYQYWKTYDDGTKRYFTFSSDKEYSYMATGFTKIGKDIFYFDKNGNKIDGGNKNILKKIGKYTYSIGPSGVLKINSFSTVGNKRYYFDKNGRMVTGFRTIAGTTYYFDPKTGAKVEGKTKNILKKVGKYTYLLGRSGAVIKNDLVRVDNTIYYFDSKGHMVKNKTITYKGAKYKIDKKGSATRI